MAGEKVERLVEGVNNMKGLVEQAFSLILTINSIFYFHIQGKRRVANLNIFSGFGKVCVWRKQSLDNVNGQIEKIDYSGPESAPPSNFVNPNQAREGGGANAPKQI